MATFRWPHPPDPAFIFQLCYLFFNSSIRQAKMRRYFRNGDLPIFRHQSNDLIFGFPRRFPRTFFKISLKFNPKAGGIARKNRGRKIGFTALLHNLERPASPCFNETGSKKSGGYCLFNLLEQIPLDHILKPKIGGGPKKPIFT